MAVYVDNARRPVPRIIAAVDEIDHKLVCDTCGDITLPAVSDLSARGRRHARRHPDHDVWLQWRATKNFFVRQATP
ncbi:hypothetical protein E1258_17565 [Micromonospora sp. KC207]|uniref:hypothetical protein n=1 Tax=Micromonospora sp. KC207 TaxID=2530377 RepID=UPI00105018B1|nr:hypothetical protein [Micromonospora sp. KC207]TDC59542.1 hypothetical protein E1258_17565 [Micromonospora sp. KC207]